MFTTKEFVYKTNISEIDKPKLNKDLSETPFMLPPTQEKSYAIRYPIRSN